MLILQTADIIVTRSNTGKFGPLIRWFTKRPQDPAWPNHVGLVTQPGYVGEGMSPQAVITEALRRVVARPVWEAYGPPAGEGRPELMIYRPYTLTQEQRDIVASVVDSHLGLKYGWQAIIWHALDTVISRQRGKETYFFRRLNFLPRTECSTLVARGFAAINLTFGIPMGVRTNPDDISDFCEANPDKYVRVFGPGRIE